MNAVLESAARPADAKECARAAFDLELERLDLLLHRETLRLRARYQLSLDEFRGLYISDRQVEELLRKANEGSVNKLIESMSGRLHGIEQELARPHSNSATPWAELRSRLDLTRREQDLVLLLLAGELDPKYETLFAYLNNDVARKLPTADLASRLFAADSRSRAELREAAAPGGRLAAMGLIEFPASGRDMPRMQRGLRLCGAVADWLLGLPFLDERLLGVATLADIESRIAIGPQEAELRRAVNAVYAGSMRSLICLASSCEESAAAAVSIVCGAGRPLLQLDLMALRSMPAAVDAAVAIELAARITGAGVVAAPLSALVDADGRVIESIAPAVRRLAGRCPLVIWAGTTESRWADVLGSSAFDAPPPLLQLRELDTSERREAWNAALGADAADHQLHSLADRFIFGQARIDRAVRLAARTAEFCGSTVDTSGLFSAARAVSTEQAIGVTRTVHSSYGWEDLVLPGAVKRRLEAIVSAIELRPRVLDDWGFATRLCNARGIKVMFAGASGTGKTMAAGIIAHTLGLDLHRVELAAVVSKYIGETEKNLDRAFDAARRANAILFIDEADALFGKRSEVKDAHDRYANVETAYLLQKMEDHDGVVILATNLAGNLDEAYSRRMQYVIEFPIPDAASRERMWRGMIPPSAPLGADVDLAFLARQFQFSGGDIRNIVLDGAFHAAQEGGDIRMRHFLAAVVRQYAKRGKLPSAGDFREYFPMLSPDPA